MADVKSVVITGSTRGIGFGLADAFLARGCHVTVSGRTQGAVDEAISKLSQKHPADRVHGAACDVAELAQLNALYDVASKPTGRVDFWLNNAGAGNTQTPFAQQKPADIEAVLKANLVGAVLATRVAIERMQAQGGGQIFNFEGFGSDGRMKRVGMATYGATKTATRYFTASIAKELEGSPVKVGTIFPGVVVTDMLVSQFDGLPAAEWDKARKFYSVIGDTVETVTPWLADQVLRNDKNGANIAWLSVPKALVRFISPSYRKRDLFKDAPKPKTVA